ncbi:hypothetical protein [Hahella ganghwensis]|uniref:hypothetical protein n=1 Tax=Hahella ganghwensis TaxID=286420 RepID=UPI00037A0306|nr:hypothetical protein [Hahella ganghwensis]
MEDLSRYVCKDCGQSSFIEWQSHRMEVPGSTVGVNSSIICLSCMQQLESSGLTDCAEIAEQCLQVAG